VPGDFGWPVLQSVALNFSLIQGIELILLRREDDAGSPMGRPICLLPLRFTCNIRGALSAFFFYRSTVYGELGRAMRFLCPFQQSPERILKAYIPVNRNIHCDRNIRDVRMEVEVIRDNLGF